MALRIKFGIYVLRFFFLISGEEQKKIRKAAIKGKFTAVTLAAAASMRTQAGMNGKLAQKEKPASGKSKNLSKTSKPNSAGKSKNESKTSKLNSAGKAKETNKDISKQTNNDTTKQANNKSKACSLQ